MDIVREAGLADGCSKQKGNLLYYVASKVTRRAQRGSSASLLRDALGRSRGSAAPDAPLAAPQYPANALVHRPALLLYIVDERIKVRAFAALQRKRRGRPRPPQPPQHADPAARRPPLPSAAQSNPQLDGAFDYLKKVGTTDLDGQALEEASGVGVVVSRRAAGAGAARRRAQCAGSRAGIAADASKQAASDGPGQASAAGAVSAPWAAAPAPLPSAERPSAQRRGPAPAFPRR